MRRLIILTLISLTGCHAGICTWEWGYTQLNVRPADERLIGQYQLTESSREYLKDRGFKDAKFRLELLGSGKFKFTNAPDLIFDTHGQSNLKLIDKEGNWSVICADSYDCMIELENVCVVPLAEKDGRLAILIAIGDGDECNGIIYEIVQI